MNTPREICVHVYPASERKLRARLFDALGMMFRISFRDCDQLAEDNRAAVIVLKGGADVTDKLKNADHPWFMADSGLPCANAKDLRLDKVPGIAHAIDRIRVREDVLPKTVLSAWDDQWKVAARCEQGAFWLWNSKLQYRVAEGPGELAERELLVDHVRPGRFLRLLPLLNFLRQLTERTEFDPMAQLASLVVDDPNLHWPTYGHIDFKRLARHATKHAYHASIAMVPLDGWWSHSGVAEIFRQNPARLSLLMHGNNHTALELAQRRSEKASVELLAQGLRRIDAFENRFGVPVARVMEPPFGVCSSMSLLAMRQLGYDAVLLAHEVVLRQSRDDNWPADFGLAVTDSSARAVPGISRQRIAGDWKTGVALNLCLGQPIVVATHHEDAVGDFHRFAEVADLLNSLGEIRWCGFDEMSKALFRTRREGNILYIQPWGWNIIAPVPAGVQEIVILPRAVEAETRVQDQVGCDLAKNPIESDRPLAVNGASRVRIISRDSGSRDFKQVRKPSFTPWPFLRRTLTATRDRGRPFLIRNGRTAAPESPT